MRQFGSVLGFGTLLALLVAFAPSDVAANKKKDAKKDKDADKYPAAVDADYKAIQKQKELYGKLVSIDGSNVSLRVEYSHYEPNPKYKPPNNANKGNAIANQQNQAMRTYNDIMRQQQQAATATNPRQYQQAMQRIAQDMNRLQQEMARMNQQMVSTIAAGQKVDPNNLPFVTVTNTKDFDLALQEKVVLRKLILPFEYDDTGKPKTYTDKEKADLRGDDKTKPGYTAKLDEFQAGQEVKLHLVPPVKKEKEADKDKEKDKDDKAPEEVLRPTVKMVVLTKDNPNATTISGADDKKKKK
jgi:hypothetical protein